MSRVSLTDRKPDDVDSEHDQEGYDSCMFAMFQHGGTCQRGSECAEDVTSHFGRANGSQ